MMSDIAVICEEYLNVIIKLQNQELPYTNTRFLLFSKTFSRHIFLLRQLHLEPLVLYSQASAAFIIFSVGFPC